MKKLFALLICLLMVVSLAACGGKSTAEAPKVQETVAAVTTVAAEETETVTEAEPIQESIAPAETEAPTEATEAAPAFDTGWAGPEYVMPIPQPPFAIYSVHFEESQNLYIIQDDSEYSDRADYDALAAYCDALKAAGYVSIEKDVLSADAFHAELGSVGASTLFAASHATGCRVLVYQEEVTPMVWVYGA